MDFEWVPVPSASSVGSFWLGLSMVFGLVGVTGCMITSNPADHSHRNWAPQSLLEAKGICIQYIIALGLEAPLIQKVFGTSF